MDKWVFWGASDLGKAAYELLKHRLNILFFIDNDPNKINDIIGDKSIFPFIDAQEKLKGTSPKILITSHQVEEIKGILLDFGIEQSEIFVFQYNISNSDNGLQNIRLDKSEIYINNYGVKTTNQLISSDMLRFEDFLEIELSLDDLYMSIDWLKDNFTLANKKIEETPHYNLMKKMHEKYELDAEYVTKRNNGLLDFRKGILCDNNFIKYSLEMFNCRKREILEETYLPIYAKRVNDKFYIVDGKHRVALAKVLGLDKIRVRVVENIYKDSFHVWIKSLAKEYTENFTINLKLYDELRR